MYQKCINSRNFQMTIPERRSVVGNDDHFSLALSKCFQSLPVSENIFSRFHHQGKPGIDVLNALFLQIYGHRSSNMAYKMYLCSLKHKNYCQFEKNMNITDVTHYFKKYLFETPPPSPQHTHAHIPSLFPEKKTYRFLLRCHCAI